ncbi:Crp/Fnr family transcriptional regulator [Chromatocurvus halotolerans]|uniref:CRP-like cAMP-binding protein n=1 Tax=Chromatocurvus halotolerans TaxID=1132028 RepID=A0A4R2L380_9GAMM|nr:Crp/Fnr family transcriptional regulator [Chromatocurvus halotolerans]TCO78389.1 CRP-like cAMP-binding protein [Chromatocurvus halotolerans]
MNTPYRGCILRQFEDFSSLGSDEAALLARLEQNPREYAAGELLSEAGQRSDAFFTVTEGWACAERVLADGTRQVLDLFMPGQILGLREVSFHRNLCDFRALTTVTACPFPRRHLTDIFDEAPRLADLFFLILAREQSMLVERVINIGRRSAAQRLAHFLVEISVRSRQSTDALELPLTQTVIGDALSLSSVHVSRTFQNLRELSLVETDNGTVRIVDLDELITFSGFDRAYLEIRSDWARQITA